MSSNWNFAEIWELCAELVPESPALVFAGGEEGTAASVPLRRSWRELDRRAAGVAKTLLDAGLGHQDKVAQYLYNCPEYLESIFGCFKAGLVPVNTNYRYRDEELHYLWDNADVTAIVFHGAFTEAVDRLRGRLPLARLFLHVDDGTGPCPDFAVPYEVAASALEGTDTESPARIRGPSGVSGDDLLLLYTGGTTGLPKGVMWRQDDLFVVVNEGSILKHPVDGGLEALRQTIPTFAALGEVLLPACPLMHGTGQLTSVAALNSSTCVALFAGRSLDVDALLRVVADEGVTLLAIVGDAFARPLVEALDASPGRYNLTRLKAIVSSGAVWSEEIKRRLVGHLPTVACLDTFGSSEAIGIASSVSTAAVDVATANFQLGTVTKVVDEEGNEIGPGSAEVGRLAIGGRLPLGYYKDLAATAATFETIDGVRYSIPGDFATVEADGTIHLLGRGSVSINTAGEKVYPEEVEEALKLHPAVLDAAAVGVPDERFGEAVTAVVELRAGTHPSDDELIAQVRRMIASYKAPRHVVVVPALERGPSGKLDYRRLRQTAIEAVNAPHGGAP